MTPEACAAGVLEISAWNQANALRQVTVKRGLDVRDFTLTTFGGSGSLLLCRLVDVLGLPAVLVPPNPGNVSAFGLLTVDVKNDYVQHPCRARRPARPSGRRRDVRRTDRAGAPTALTNEGFTESEHRFDRTADLRYFGQAFEVRVPVPSGELDAGLSSRSPTGSTPSTGRSTATTSPATPASRSSGSTSGSPGSARSRRPTIARHGGRRRPSRRPRPGQPAGLLRRRRRVRRHPGPLADDLAPARRRPGRPIIEEFGSTVPLHPGFTARIDDYLNIIVTRERQR